MWRRRIITAGWWVAVVCFFLGPYAQLPWWPFPASTVVLLALFLQRWRSTALERVGLQLNGRRIVRSLALAAGLWAFFDFLWVPALAESAGLVREAAWPWSTAQLPFQALNEEMVLLYRTG